MDNGSNIVDGQAADVACDSYHKYPEDIRILKNLGVNFYRFSISWPRIIPTGRLADGVNQAGIDYYNKLIDGLLAEGIQPFVTLYHWDLPLGLLDEGGWLNASIADHFGDYSRVAFREFGDRVKLWLTFNEPLVFCLADFSYGTRNSFKEPPEKPYICGHHVVLAHAVSYRIYEKEFKPSQNGTLGITLNTDWAEPADPDKWEDRAASRRAMYFTFGWWADPIVHGRYPLIMRELIDKRDEEAGRLQSRLPTFDANWTEIIKGSTDFLGINHYSSHTVEPAEEGRWIDGDAHVKRNGWFVAPWGFRKLLNWIHDEYHLPIYVTENGWGAPASEGLDDQVRLDYYVSYINDVLKAVKLDGADVRGYSAWSLIDNYEWSAGFTSRYGIHYVNFSDPNLERVPKASAHKLKEIFANHGFPEQ
jgi:lactase-phlorizin hydrolase